MVVGELGLTIESGTRTHAGDQKEADEWEHQCIALSINWGPYSKSPTICGLFLQLESLHLYNSHTLAMAKYRRGQLEVA